MAGRSIPARIRFNRFVASADEGLPASRLAVDLTSDRKMRTAWRGEIVIPGDPPWQSGDERIVELEIEAKPFEDYVACWRPTLFACRDDEIIAQIEVTDAPLSDNRGGLRREG